MHSGLKSEHDVYHFKAYVYPIAKAPLSDLTARAINKCLDEAQLYQRTRFDNMVRPFIGPLKDIRPEGLGFVALVEYLKQFTRQQRSEEEAEAAATADVRVEFEVQLSKLPKPGFWSAGLNEAPFKGAYFKLTLYLSNTPYPITQRDFQRIAKLRFADTRADVITLIFGNVKKTVKDRRPLTRVNKGRALCNWMANTLQDLPDMAKEELREAASKL